MTTVTKTFEVLATDTYYIIKPNYRVTNQWSDDLRVEGTWTLVNCADKYDPIPSDLYTGIKPGGSIFVEKSASRKELPTPGTEETDIIHCDLVYKDDGTGVVLATDKIIYELTCKRLTL